MNHNDMAHIHSSSSESEDEPQNNRFEYDLWNIHPLIGIFRAIKYQRKLRWQLYLLGQYWFNLHIYMLLLVFQYDIYVGVNGNKEVLRLIVIKIVKEVQEFIAMSIAAIVFSWPFIYAFGFLISFFKKKRVINLENDYETE